MSPAVLRRIMLVLGVVVALWLLLALIRRWSTGRAEGITLPRVTKAEAEQVTFAGASDTVRLSRDSAGWLVNGHKAAAAEIERLFQALADTSARSELVARKAASHQRLGVDSSAGRRMTVSGGGKALADLWFGNRGPDFEGFYVRQAGDDRVYLLRGRTGDLTALGVDDWRERRMLALTPDSILAVEISRGKERYRLERAGLAWRIAGRAGPDTAKVNRLVAAVAQLTATGFPDTAESRKADFSPAERRVLLQDAAAGVLAVIELDSVTDGWVARVGADGEPFRLSGTTVDQIAPAEAALRH